MTTVEIERMIHSKGGELLPENGDSNMEDENDEERAEAEMSADMTMDHEQNDAGKEENGADEEDECLQGQMEIRSAFSEIAVKLDSLGQTMTTFWGNFESALVEQKGSYKQRMDEVQKLQEYNRTVQEQLDKANEGLRRQVESGIDLPVSGEHQDEYGELSLGEEHRTGEVLDEHVH